MNEQYVTIDLEDLLIGEELPGTVYLYLDFRFITFRGQGDVVDTNAYDRLQVKKVKQLFIMEKDRPSFAAWTGARKVEVAANGPITESDREFHAVRDDAHRKMLDIFHSEQPNKIVTQALSASKRLVGEVMKVPYASKPLNQLQTYSRGSVDHSVNVSILSVYLAMQMGYAHALILQHVGAGALLHDIGKSRVPVDESDTPEQEAEKMEQHPILAQTLLGLEGKVPNEVVMIVAQHHECHDGSGYPKKLKGNNIYDLARIVAIANVFDELVADGKGLLVDRQRNAISQLDQVLCHKFDPQKLDKALKILKLGV